MDIKEYKGKKRIGEGVDLLLFLYCILYDCERSLTFVQNTKQRYRYFTPVFYKCSNYLIEPVVYDFSDCNSMRYCCYTCLCEITKDIYRNMYIMQHSFV